MVKKSEVRKVVDKTFGACKITSVKKLCIRAIESYAGLSERKILEVANKHTKYRKLNLKFMNKIILRPAKVPDATEQVQVDLVDLLNTKDMFSGMCYR